MTEPIKSRFLDRHRLPTLLANLISFLKHPIQEIARVPNWSWTELVFVQVCLTAATGALTGLVSRSFLGVLSGIFLTPILTMVTIAGSALFFYYVFQIFARQTLPFRRLVTVVFFANLPFFLLQVLSSLVPPISLIGFAFSGVILAVGLIDNFQLPRQLVIRVTSLVFVTIFCIWIWGRFESRRMDQPWRQEKSNAEGSAPEVKLGE